MTSSFEVIEQLEGSNANVNCKLQVPSLSQVTWFKYEDNESTWWTVGDTAAQSTSCVLHLGHVQRTDEGDYMCKDDRTGANCTVHLIVCK